MSHEINRAQKDKYQMISHIRGIPKWNDLIEIQSEREVSRGRGVSVRGEKDTELGKRNKSKRSICTAWIS